MLIAIRPCPCRLLSRWRRKSFGVRNDVAIRFSRMRSSSFIRRANQSKSCQAPLAKIFLLHISVNQNYKLAPSHPRGGALAIVTKRWDGMRWTLGVRRVSRRTKRCARTAKSCGPGAAMLAPSLAEQVPADDGDNKPAHRGEHDISRKAIAQGMSECSPLTCMLVCAFLCALWHTRPRVQRAPGIPCALCSQEGQRIWKTRAKRAARTRTHVTAHVVPANAGTHTPRRQC